jgi:hypothetical protein
MALETDRLLKTAPALPWLHHTVYTRVETMTVEPEIIPPVEILFSRSIQRPIRVHLEIKDLTVLALGLLGMGLQPVAEGIIP